MHHCLRTRPNNLALTIYDQTFMLVGCLAILEFSRVSEFYLISNSLKIAMAAHQDQFTDVIYGGRFEIQDWVESLTFIYQHNERT